jgi:DNA invertase Pin-like site-specific DNA recombinase
MDVVLIARVSTEEQNRGDAVSIDQQLADMRALCARNGWHIVAEFIDDKDYIATQQPKKGKVVNPSGERADRPGLLAALDRVKTGDVDGLLCWRDDRLMRHPRVAVVVEDALDQADAVRNGRGKVQIYDATGATIDRFTLGIKAVIWREENKRRVERITMGKVGTLQSGRWPGRYERWGYTTREKLGKRGRVIELASPEEVQIVKDIFDLFDKGLSIMAVRQELIRRGIGQKAQKWIHQWNHTVIRNILHSKDYTGQATWRFANGSEYSIQIPQIITPDQWQRVQARLDRNNELQLRNTHGIYLLQGILRCGDCGSAVGVHTKNFVYGHYYPGRRRTRRDNPNPSHYYRCTKVPQYPEEAHPRPCSWQGKELDWAVWRKIVDDAISRPDVIIEQVQARQAELQAQGDSVDGDIARAIRKLSELDLERAFYLKQGARGMITEAEFDASMAETGEAITYWKSEIHRLCELRDNAGKTKAALEYGRQFLTALQERLPAIDQTPAELTAMPKDARRSVLKQRQEIIRALAQEVKVYADGRVEVLGVIDGNEGAQVDLPTQYTDPGCRPGSGPVCARRRSAHAGPAGRH